MYNNVHYVQIWKEWVHKYVKNNLHLYGFKHYVPEIEPP